jgi:multidrug transporter EmrE-like cation transporter
MILDKLRVIPALGWILIATFFYAGGEFGSKLWGYRPSLWMTAAVVGSYAIGALCWLPALLHKNELARMSMLWAVIATPLTIILGTVVFREKLTGTQWIGIGLAMAALWLLKD